MDIIGKKSNLVALANKWKTTVANRGNRGVNSTLNRNLDLPLDSHRNAELIILVPTSISVTTLALRLSIRPVELIKVLLQMGSTATFNQVLDQRTAAAVVKAAGFTAVAARK